MENCNTKILIVFLLLALSLQFYLAKTKAQFELVHGSDFRMYFPAASNLAFQSDIDKTLTLQATSGTLNGTSTSLTMDENSGTLQFTSQNTAMLKATFTFQNVQVTGDQGKTTRNINSGDTFTITPTDVVTISWMNPLEPIVPYMFIFGMIGLGAMFGGPIYAIQKVKHKEYQGGIVWGFILFMLGFAFVLGWLWA